MSATLVLVRHGESTGNAAGRFQGQTDPGLSDRGREQASRLAVHIAERFEDVTAAWASDLVRVRETSEPTLARLGVEPVVDERLREIDVGAWSGRSYQEVQADDPAALGDWVSFVDVDRPGMERMTDFRVRVRDMLVELHRKATEGTTLVFTHGMWIRTAVAFVLGAETGRHLAPATNTSLTLLATDPRDETLLRLLSYNESSHLR